MSTIEVKDDEDKRFEELCLYRKAVSICSDIKVCFGPTTLNATLRDHKDFKKFIMLHMKNAILDVESNLPKF